MAAHGYVQEATRSVTMCSCICMVPSIRASDLGRELASGSPVAVDEELAVDITVSKSLGVVVVTQDEVVDLDEDAFVDRCQCLKAFKRSLVLLAQSASYPSEFNRAQEIAAMDLELSVIPFQTQSTAAAIIKAAFVQELKNHKALKPSNRPDAALLDQVSMIPGVGPKSAAAMLKGSATLHELAGATREVLMTGGGANAGKKAHKFFNQATS